MIEFTAITVSLENSAPVRLIYLEMCFKILAFFTIE